uniref:Protein TPX2 n=1 Tax=Cucumis melo TaxID=3656 RepID=A0A9I9D3X6_CUCME
MEKEMETDEEMKEVYDKPFVWEEIDLDYEFDVAMYYDFTRPETEKEIKEAEDWFKFAGTYPPSPFVLKLKGEEEVQAECNSMELKNVQNHWDDHKNSEINENDPVGSNLVNMLCWKYYFNC